MLPSTFHNGTKFGKFLSSKWYCCGGGSYDVEVFGMYVDYWMNEYC